MLSLLLALLPIAVIVVMLIVFKKPAHTSGIVGWLAVSLVAFLFFRRREKSLYARRWPV